MKYLLGIGIIICFFQFSKAQTAKKEFNRAYSHLKYEEWRMAVPYLEKAIGYEPGNVEVNFWLGKCYWLTGKKDKCLPLFETVVKAKPDFDEMLPLYYAGALHFSMKFDEAIKEYLKLREKYKPTSQEFLKLSNLIAQCNSGKILVKKPVQNIKIENVGPNINSEYPDFAPVVTADESSMIFTSRRKGNLGDIAIDGFPFEDLYISERSGKTWAPAKNMGTTINTTGHDACIAVSADGQKLYIFRDDNGGDVFESKLKGDKWGEPKNMGKRINTKYWEPSVYVTADGKNLFFTSNKPGGLGGRDIYVSYLQKDGSWSEGMNLGPQINTPFDDDAPFLHPDGKTFYFSSEGHNSMGGFDIFKAEWRNGTWTKPINMGYPINTTDDDIYFVISASGRNGYYASSKAGGYGEKDIYRISFEPPKLDSLVTINQPKHQDTVKTEIAIIAAPALTMLKGIITDEKTGLPVEATLYVIDNEKNDTISELTSNSATGKYLVTLPSGKNYGIVVQHPNYIFHSENIDIPQKSDFQEIERNIPLKSLAKGTKIVLKNIFFDFDKATLRTASVAELTRLHKILVEHPSMKIKIGGHTDNVGSDDYNQKLSENRSKSVVEWLIKNGIAQERLQYQGYGEKVPIDTNDTDEGRQNNRRTEFEVIEN